MEEAFTDAVNYFGEEVSTTNSEEFFHIFSKFDALIQEAIKQNELSAANLEKAKRREDAKTKRVFFIPFIFQI